eukprot:TRINITY_DN25776_c0_g1_i1.p1 TRINITY_DN25776_c0_g1~~TRINITY_DN25776_c0_g1_i1.p1  ORF type:complete len:458 (+),score=69.52 TRINITY_DN25776_c0_g1_i1:57-1376(+)
MASVKMDSLLAWLHGRRLALPLVLCVSWTPLLHVSGHLRRLAPRPWPHCLREAQDPECFAGTSFRCEDCCDTVLAGPGGNERCWGEDAGGAVYNYARCCPACPAAAEASCFDEAGASGSRRSCAECCDRRHGPKGNEACWQDDASSGDAPRSFERCCLGRPAICVPSLPGSSSIPGHAPGAAGVRGNAASNEVGGGASPTKSAKLRAALQTSAFGQERFALRWLGCPAQGFYLDIGAYDGEHLSNTHALDVDLGWRGICIDAVFRPDRFKTRSCRQVQAAIYNTSGMDVSFRRYQDHHADAYGGLSVGAEPEELAAQRVSSNGDDGGYDSVLGRWDMVRMQTRTITDILASQAPVPSVIDFVSVDVEGVVLQALEGFPFHSHCVRVWALELEDPLGSPTQRANFLAAMELLRKQEYVMVADLRTDKVFVHVQDCAAWAA